MFKLSIALLLITVTLTESEVRIAAPNNVVNLGVPEAD